MKMKDDSIMPYGKHQGTELANVPAEYFIWMYDNDKLSRDLKQYVEENMDALILETRGKQDD